MRKITRNIFWGCVTVLGWLLLYVAYYNTHKDEVLQQAKLAALLNEGQSLVEFQAPVKFSDCKAQGPLPDPECTPGAIFPNATKEQICVSGYSSTVRNVSVSLKKKIFSQYGIAYPVPFGSYEIDHLIPLSLGGSNEVANLWPKSAEPFPGFYEKNITGNYLLQEVCEDRIVLSIAQQKIAENWFLIYQHIPESKIQELKQRYKNWAD